MQANLCEFTGQVRSIRLLWLYVLFIVCTKCTSTSNRIDSRLEQQSEKDNNYWYSVLSRVIEVIKFLFASALAFRGNDELTGSPDNGNFLGALELFPKFDPYLADLITYHVLAIVAEEYLTSTVCKWTNWAGGFRSQNAYLRRRKASPVLLNFSGLDSRR